jgi:hypothetical protein
MGGDGRPIPFPQGGKPPGFQIPLNELPQGQCKHCGSKVLIQIFEARFASALISPARRDMWIFNPTGVKCEGCDTVMTPETLIIPKEE